MYLVLNIANSGEKGDSMDRKNIKTHSINYSNTIRKSNELSMAKLNQGLTLNQMQLLAFAIFSAQQNGKTEFRKHEFQKKFGIKDYKTDDAYADSQRLSILQFSTQDLENDKFSFTNVFSSIKYDSGHFTFKWNEDMIPHILELKEKYVLTDLTITSNFRSGFSWILYDYLKAHYGYWHKELSKESLMKLFAVEERKTYKNSTAQLKRSVLDVAIAELNKYTELEVCYTQEKVGNKITGFTLRWSMGKREAGATDRQIALLREIHDEVEKRVFDCLTLKNSNSLNIARTHILRIKEINQQVNEKLASKQVDDFIQEAKLLYGQLQKLLENDGKERDTSFYFNWLESEE